MALLSIKNLTVRFATSTGAFTAVDGVDISVDEREVLAIVGESGSGKSVSMLAVMGLLADTATVTADEMTYDGQDISNLTTAHAFKPGSSPLDGTGVLGRVYAAAESGFIVDLVAEEENDARGTPWAAVVRRRLDARVLPMLRPYRLPLVVRLKVLVHASWLQVEAGEQTKGFLGYDRFKTKDESGHTIIVYRHATTDPDDAG